MAARTGELAKANERLMILDRSKNDFLNLISHEFRTPLNGLLGVGELILAGMPFTVDNDVLRAVFERSRRRILSILDDALLLTQIDVSGQQFRSSPVSLDAVLNQAILSATEFAGSRRVVFTPSDADLGLVLGNADLLARAFQALLEAAVKFSENGGTVRLTSETTPGSRNIIIESCGRSVPVPALAKLFDVLSIGEAITPGGDLGVGLPLAQRILSLFGASVRAENQIPMGVRLTISLMCGQ